MKASEIIAKLSKIIDNYGDIKLSGDYNNIGILSWPPVESEFFFCHTEYINEDEEPGEGYILVPELENDNN